MKKIKYFLLLFVCFSLLHCSKESEIQPKKLTEYEIKSKLFYNNIEDSIPEKIFDYQYNDINQLEKIYHRSGNNPSEYYKYESFEYKDNKLNVKYTYHYVSETLSWTIFDLTKYSYQDKKLISEVIYYLTEMNEVISYKYLYENSNIIEKRKYYNQEFENLTKFEYTEGLCTKESIFTDSIGSEQIEYIIHSYTNSILSKSEKYLNNNSKIQSISYTYNNEGYLIIEHSEQTDFTITKPLNYVIRYEYR